MGDITGIIKNALERGWQKNEIAQSLTNAGYTQQEIESEIQLLTNSSTSQTSIMPQVPQNSLVQKISAAAQNTPQKIEIPNALLNSQPSFNPQSLKNYQTPQLEKPKEIPTSVIVILIFLLIITIIGAGLFFFL